MYEILRMDEVDAADLQRASEREARADDRRRRRPTI